MADTNQAKAGNQRIRIAPKNGGSSEHLVDFPSMEEAIAKVRADAARRFAEHKAREAASPEEPDTSAPGIG